MRILGALVGALVVVSVGDARAEPFVELQGGVGIPLTSDQRVASGVITDSASISPKVRLAAGALFAKGFGAAISADWTAVEPKGDDFPSDTSEQRYRILANAVYHYPVGPGLVIAGRVGVGVDIVHANVSFADQSVSDTKAGLAFEIGGGIWKALGPVQIGAEVALPIGVHSSKGNALNGDFAFDYTSLDLDVLVGVRVSL